MNSGVLSRRDLDFLLFEWLRVDELAKRQRFAEHTTDVYEPLCVRYAATGSYRALDRDLYARIVAGEVRL